MTDIYHTLAVIAVASICTAAVRFAPFLIFRGNKEIPKSVQYLGNILPPAVIATLVIYCLKDINFLSLQNGIPELVSVGIVATLHLWKNNVLLSIGGGTIIYMILTQIII